MHSVMGGHLLHNIVLLEIVSLFSIVYKYSSCIMDINGCIGFVLPTARAVVCIPEGAARGEYIQLHEVVQTIHSRCPYVYCLALFSIVYIKHSMS